MTMPTYGADRHRLALTVIRLLRSDEWRLVSNKYRERVTRAALLIDWAATGRLINGAAAVELDTRPTGTPGADALLAAVEGKPDRPLQHWLSARVPVVKALAQRLCDQGVWQPFQPPPWHCYRDHRGAELAALRVKLEAIEEDYQHADPELIALAMLNQLVAPIPTIIPAELINENRCRQLTWILRMVRDYFERELPRFNPLRLQPAVVPPGS